MPIKIQLTFHTYPRYNTQLSLILSKNTQNKNRKSHE